MASVLPPTEGRVPMHSPKGANKRIQDAAIARVRATAEGTSDLDRALHALRREWDMERTLEFNASIAAGTGVVLGMSGYPNWLWLSVGVLAFLFQHALQGWCPPMPVFRFFGFRTAEEIEDEITALRVLRGDFAFVDKFAGDRAQLAERMAGNKQRRGSFVGTSAAKEAASPSPSASAAAKEE